MPINKVSSGNNATAVAFEIGFTDNVTIKLTKQQLTTFDTQEKLDAFIKTQTSGRPEEIYLHKNRDGRIAVATGSEPDTWPEDLT